MIDRSMLIDALQADGLVPESSDVEIMQMLASLGYNKKQSNEALKIIRTKFPAPQPYVPEDLTKIKVMPTKRIKIERIKPEPEKPQAPLPNRIKIPRVYENEQEKVVVPAPKPIKIPWIHSKEEVKAEKPLPQFIKLPKITGDEDKIKKALLDSQKNLSNKTFVSKTLQFVLFSDQLKLFSKDFVHNEETLKQKRSIEIKFFVTLIVLVAMGLSGGIYFVKIVVFLSHLKWGSSPLPETMPLLC